jgi:uncharacterized protein YbjT (DUF2867 family)
MKIVVIGGTGLIGSHTVESLKQRGHDAVAAAPNTGVDTITGKGLAEALSGSVAVVDVSNSPSFEDQAAMDFFQTAGRNIAAAETAAGVAHMSPSRWSAPTGCRRAAISAPSSPRRR